MSKVTIDDIAVEAGISRATLYRLFPGGRDVLFDALRRRETSEFFDELESHVDQADSLEDFVVRVVVESTRQLRADQHLQVMLASEPGSVAASLSFEGLPIIFQTASAYLSPRVAAWIGAELLSRLVVTYFLVPSRYVDLGDPESANRFVRSFVLPAFAPTQKGP
jgi:AcrR family transcriptional regulator